MQVSIVNADGRRHRALMTRNRAPMASFSGSRRGCSDHRSTTFHASRRGKRHPAGSSHKTLESA
jgi:hypothetical protein